MLASVGRNGLLLALFALLATALVAATHLRTAEQITANRLAAQRRALAHVLPVISDGELRPIDLPDPVALALPDLATGWVLANNGATSAVVLPVVAPDGYTGRIDLIVGITSDGRISGVEVLSHRETPGLGDRIERSKSDWLKKFVGRSATDPSPADWTVRKGGGVFDQFTGATVTPRATVHAIKRALEYFSAHRKQLLRAPSNG